MSNLDLVLKNCLLVNEGQQTPVDIGIKGDRIEKIASEITEDSKEAIDLEGKYIAPGIIDDQVHFRDPGLTEKGDIRSESLAAIHAGVTSTFDMPNVDPNTTTAELLVKRNQLGAEKSWTNYSYYFGATETNLEEIRKLDPFSIYALVASIISPKLCGGDLWPKSFHGNVNWNFVSRR